MLNEGQSWWTEAVHSVSSLLKKPKKKPPSPYVDLESSFLLGDVDGDKDFITLFFLRTHHYL